MNVSQLQLPPPPQLQRVSRDASEQDADFLALRLLNKRSRLRLSPEPIPLDSLPARTRLFAVANSNGWFAAAARNPDGSNVLLLSPLHDLRSAFASPSPDGSPLPAQPRITIPLPATPHILSFNHNDTRLLIAFTDGSLSVYDSHSIFHATSSIPLHTFSSGQRILDIYPSSADSENVAILRLPGNTPPVEILDIQNLTSIAGWSPSTSPGVSPTTVSWSPKGKQIAIGLENGDILTFIPTDTSSLKSVVPHPPSVQGQTLISLAWLSNSEFHAIYAPAGPLTPESEQTHFILSLDSKASTTGDVKLTTPYLPFPGLRPPAPFVVTIRSWDPSRLLLFVGDSTSSDIGLIGSLSVSTPSSLDSWCNLTLEETSTPSVPLDADMNDTVILGLELDLTNSQPFKFTASSGEEKDVPPPPIMYLYASDGTLTGWYIIHTHGVPYPGMVSPVSTPTAVPAPSSVAVSEQASNMASPQHTFAAATSPFASASPHNTSSTGGTFGFSAFSGAPSAFGTSSFGFGSQQPQQPLAQSSLNAPALSTPSISVEMTSAVDESTVSETGPDFGGLSLGIGGNGGESKSGDGTNSMFGSFGTTTPQPSASTFGNAPVTSSTLSKFGAGPIQPGTGFGAFANTGSSAFGSFGNGGAFGGLLQKQASTPSASVFGQSSFGTPSTTPTTTPSSKDRSSTTAFGAPSDLGGGRSTGFFSQTTSSTPPKNVFSAFSGGASAFGAVAASSSGKSFGEMLRQKDGEQSTNVSDEKKDVDKSGVSRTAEEWKKPVSVFASLNDVVPRTPVKGKEAGDGGEEDSTFANAGSSTFGSFGNGGAFGGLLQKQASTPSTSVFGQSSFGTPSTTPTTTPLSKDGSATTAFGAPSDLGGGRSTGFFTQTTSSTPPKNAFSAFSGGASAFGAVAASSSGKSFGEMLRQKDGEQSTNVSDEKKDVDKSGVSRTAEEWKKPVSVFASLNDVVPRTPVKGKEVGDGVEEEVDEAETSFRDDEEDDSDEGDDGIDAFLKSDEEDLVSDGEAEDMAEEEEDESDVEDGEEKDYSEEAAAVAPSPPEFPTIKQAAQPETPQTTSVDVPLSTTLSKEEEVEPSKPIPVRDGSTTPPGSPSDRASPAPFAKPGLAPAANRATSAPPTTAPASTTSIGLLGVGRPSTRPTRSSPLASRPISGDDDDDEDEDKISSPTEAKKARSASPALPAPLDATFRPKTPPVLFSGAVAPPRPTPFSLAPTKSPSPVAGKPAEPKPSTASSSPSLSGPGTPGGSSPFSVPPPVFVPPAMPQGGFFGQKPPAVPTAQLPLFNQKPTVSIFGVGGGLPMPKPSSPVPVPPSSITPVPVFGVPAPKLSLGSTPPPPVGTSAFHQSIMSNRPPPPQTTPAQDMQSECLNLYQSLTRELEDMKTVAVQASSRTAQLAKPGNNTKTCQDLNEPTKWVLSDLSQFKHIMNEVDRGIGKWEQEKATCISHMRELESDMLKGSTREEEIERFSKASKDVDFARMLKARILSPDHLETQAQLRRDIRTIRGRLQQLEDYIQSSKKKLNSVKNGKPSIKPPTLEMINRTYWNIDQAIDQDEESVYNLTERLGKLELSSNASPLLSFSGSTRDKRLPDRTHRRASLEVTPNIAESTAAALNAERSAQKLKRALLNTRKTPLVNTKAVDALPQDRELRTPRKPLLAPDSELGIGAAFTAGLHSGSRIAAPIKAEPDTPVLQWSAPPLGSLPPPAWSLPPFDLASMGGSPLSGLGASRPRGAREKQHAKPIQISHKTPPPPPPAGFSWGPVPNIQPKTSISIFAGLGGKKNERDGGTELGGSWVADGFGESTPKK